MKRCHLRLFGLVILISVSISSLLFYFSSLKLEWRVATAQIKAKAMRSGEGMSSQSGSGIRDGFIVYTPSCQVPDVDLWHDSVLPYVKKNTPSLHCKRSTIRPDLTHVKGNVLYIRNESIQYYGGALDYCEYVEIVRPLHSDSSYQLGHHRYSFNVSIRVTQEYIKVYCYAQNNSMVYQNQYAFTPNKPAMRRVKDVLFQKHKRRGYLETLNVLMVGIDSISRLNFRRQFPKTFSFLKERLDAYEMFGYNKVRDNTYINLVPLFLGKYVEETGWNETQAGVHSFDKYPYSWKKFSDAGYHTLFAEDAPRIAIWNFEKPGFTHSPADYYFRPFSLSLASTSKMWSSDCHCFGERLETDITLNYISSFIRTRDKAPYFAFTFLTRPTYDSVNQNTDTSHVRFLNELTDSGLLANTAVIYFSDHGARRGEILSTYIGKLEERLPAMFISLPKWFRARYPHIATNLQVNQHRLTTPFDIHALLDDMLRFDDRPREKTTLKSRSISLFDQIPETRSCQSATIDDHWCTCLQRQPISTNSSIIRKIAKEIIKYLNHKTEAMREKCVIYELLFITDALQSTPHNKLLTFKGSINDVIGRQEFYGDSAVGRIVIYLVTIVVSPGQGQFQATVQYDGFTGRMHVSHDISRTSLYGNASSCVTDHEMKKFCFCKTQTNS